MELWSHLPHCYFVSPPSSNVELHLPMLQCFLRTYFADQIMNDAWLHDLRWQLFCEYKSQNKSDNYPQEQVHRNIPIERCSFHAVLLLAEFFFFVFCIFFRITTHLFSNLISTHWEASKVIELLQISNGPREVFFCF